MIDFHSHVLPGIDDGAKDVETSVAMLEESKRQGVTTIVCTPHYSGRKHSPARFKEKRNAAYERLKPHIPEGIELRLGAEVFFPDDSVLSNEQLAMLTIEGTRYVMIEFPFTPTYPERLFERIEGFIAETDCIPLIAHADRYPAVWKNPSIVSRLIDMGCVVQLNAEAFADKGAKKLARVLLEKGMVHAVGSDMHNMAGRAPCMEKYVEGMRAFGLESECDKIMSSAAEILADEVVRGDSKPIRKFLGKYF